MPLRSLLLMLCAQNPRIEDDLDALTNFLKTMRESVQGMRTSLQSLHASAVDFHTSLQSNKGDANKKHTEQPYKEPEPTFQEEEIITAPEDVSDIKID